VNIIPAIDLKDGQCVRLLRGEFDSKTVYSDDPVAVAAEFSQLGCANLHVVDLDGARSGNQANRNLIRRIRSTTKFTIQVGGGIRDVSDIDYWLDAGIDRCVVGSVAVLDKPSVKSWFETYGADRIVLALDVRISANQTPFLSTHGWTKNSDETLWQCIDEYLESGLEHMLCTDISRDGAMSGPNIALYRDIVDRYPGVALQASGGVRNVTDLEALEKTGARGAITGRALLDGGITKQEIQSFLHRE
jgi:phosphoribosylformimino-5-aminoimidazole carboxamide ribotide isomerase